MAGRDGLNGSWENGSDGRAGWLERELWERDLMWLGRRRRHGLSSSGGAGLWGDKQEGQDVGGEGGLLCTGRAGLSLALLCLLTRDMGFRAAEAHLGLIGAGARRGQARGGGGLRVLTGSHACGVWLRAVEVAPHTTDTSVHVGRLRPVEGPRRPVEGPRPSSLDWWCS